MSAAPVPADRCANADALESAIVVDLRFEIFGRSLPADRRSALAEAVLEHLPWFADDPGCGIHPVRGAPMNDGALGISRRARLVLRLPRTRVDAARALEGRRLSLGAEDLDVGGGKVWPIAASATLYARLVIAGPEDEAAFGDAVSALLAEPRIACDRVFGQRGSVDTREGTRSGFSVLLHGMSPQQSLLLQERGLGAHRLYGCGIMVPHKSVAAVSP